MNIKHWIINTNINTNEHVLREMHICSFDSTCVHSTYYPCTFHVHVCTMDYVLACTPSKNVDVHVIIIYPKH